MMKAGQIIRPLLCVAAGASVLGLGAQPAQAQQFEQASPPEYIELTGIVRDFHEKSHASGHPDFERRPNSGFGHYAGNVAEQLGEDGKPVFTGNGHKVSSQWKDSANRPICYTLFDSSTGDVAGSWGSSDTGGIASADSFNQWFRDVPGVNMSKTVTIRLNRQSDGKYVFNDKDDPMYSSLGGFFPIENQLLGQSGGSPDRNFHFTFELHTQFTYDADGAQIFEFTGDDDVWVFINGQKVIDLGGVHSAVSQTADLNRLGLEDGETYMLSFFFAERHRTQSNCKISTNLQLENVELPSISAMFD